MPGLIGSPCAPVAMTNMSSATGARCSIGRPKKLLPDECKKALRRLDGGESRAAVARSYGVSKSTVSRLVQSARLSGGLVVAGLATPALSNP